MERERGRRERGGEPSGGSQVKDQRGQDGRLREEGRVEGDAERLEIVKLRVKQLTSVKDLLAATYWAGCHVVILLNLYTNTTLVLSHRFFFFFFLAAPCGLWHASFPTRD